MKRSLFVALLLVGSIALAQSEAPGADLSGLGGASLTAGQTFVGTNRFSATLWSDVASGANGIAFSVDGARLDLGTGANDYFASNGTAITTPAAVTFGSTINATQFLGPASTTAQFYGQMADGAAAIGTKIGSSVTYANATAKLVSIQNATTEKAFFDLNGALSFPGIASGATAITLVNGAYLAIGDATLKRSGSGTIQINDGTGVLASPVNTSSLQIGVAAHTVAGGSSSNTFKLTSNTVDGATNIGTTISTSNTFSTTGAKLLSVQNPTGTGNEKFFIDKDGSQFIAKATLRTCAVALEGLVSSDTAAGGTTGKRTKRCLCTSDGAGTPAYAWQNIVTGTIGTTTTCGTE